jgi:hypothetical protein
MGNGQWAMGITSVRYKIIGKGRQEARGKRQEWEELIKKLVKLIFDDYLPTLILFLSLIFALRLFLKLYFSRFLTSNSGGYWALVR